MGVKANLVYHFSTIPQFSSVKKKNKPVNGIDAQRRPGLVTITRPPLVSHPLKNQILLIQ